MYNLQLFVLFSQEKFFFWNFYSVLHKLLKPLGYIQVTTIYSMISSFNPNPLERSTAWGMVIGGTFMWLLVYGVNQSQIQRYLSLPSMKKAQM